MMTTMMMMIMRTPQASVDAATNVKCWKSLGELTILTCCQYTIGICFKFSISSW